MTAKQSVMMAKQTSCVLLLQHTARRLGLIGSCLALISACSGSIEETEVDVGHQTQGNTGKKDQAAPTSETTTPVSKPATTPAATPATTPAVTPATTPAAMTPAAMTPVIPDPEPAGPEALSFKADIWPIFNEGCAPCHTGGGSGGQDIGDADKDAAFDDAKAFKGPIVADINTGAMPLGCGKPPGGGGNCLTKADADLIKAWVDGGTPP
jgi:hypothetical protein